MMLLKCNWLACFLLLGPPQPFERLVIIQQRDVVECQSHRVHHVRGCLWVCGGVIGPLFGYVKLRVVHAPGMQGTLSPSPRFTDPDMHHGTCVTHVPWCMPGSLTGDGEENVSGIPGTCATHNFTIWKEAHVISFPVGNIHINSWAIITKIIKHIHVEIFVRKCSFKHHIYGFWRLHNRNR